MLIEERTAGDLQRLVQLARREKRAEQKDRLLAAALAIQKRETKNIQKALSRSRVFVQRWAYMYRDGGIEALKNTPRGGSLTKISGDSVAKLKARIDAGATEADGMCTLRGKDIHRIAREEFDAKVSLTSVSRTLHKWVYMYAAVEPATGARVTLRAPHVISRSPPKPRSVRFFPYLNKNSPAPGRDNPTPDARP